MGRVQDPDLQQVLVFHHVTTLQSNRMTQGYLYAAFQPKWLKTHLLLRNPGMEHLCRQIRRGKVRTRAERGAQMGTIRYID